MSGTGFQVFNAAFSAAADFIYAVCLALFLRAFMIEQGCLLYTSDAADDMQ